MVNDYVLIGACISSWYCCLLSLESSLSILHLALTYLFDRLKVDSRITLLSNLSNFLCVPRRLLLSIVKNALELCTTDYPLLIYSFWFGSIFGFIDCWLPFMMGSVTLPLTFKRFCSWLISKEYWGKLTVEAKLFCWFLRAGLSKVASNYSQSVCSSWFIVASFLASYDLLSN